MTSKRIKVKIKELGKVVGGATPSTRNPENWGGSIPWVTPKDLANHRERFIKKGEKSISQKGYDSCSTKMLPKGTVLFSSRAPIGYCAIAENDICTNQGFKSIIPNENTDSLFLYYLLKSNVDAIANNASGTTFLEISGKAMEEIEVAIPEDKNEQRQIAQILDAFDKKIENNLKLNDYLTELLSELFNEIIYRVVDHSDFLEFSAFLTERKEKCLSKTYMEYSVTDSGIQLRKQKFHKNLSASSSMNKIIRKNDLVFGISRKILNWGLFENEIGEVSSAYRVYSIKTLPPEYIARYIKHNQISFMDIIKPSSREGQGIMPDVLMSKFIPIVDSKKWEKYIHVVQPIKGKLSNLEDETIALSKIRDALLIKLLEGKISVTESTIA